jgi:hypothetical protein
VCVCVCVCVTDSHSACVCAQHAVVCVCVCVCARARVCAMGLRTGEGNAPVLKRVCAPTSNVVLLEHKDTLPCSRQRRRARETAHTRSNHNGVETFRLELTEGFVRGPAQQLRRHVRGGVRGRNSVQHLPPTTKIGSRPPEWPLALASFEWQHYHEKKCCHCTS